MGGPGGANVKPKVFHQAIDFSIREDDFYRSSSCGNCHQSIPVSSCSHCHDSKVFLSDTLLPKPSPCNAESRWPEFAQSKIPHIQDYPWWINQNFLSTSLQKPGNPIQPEKIDFGIEVLLKPGIPFQINSDYTLETMDEAKIVFAPHLAGKGENLSILLEGQSLIELQNIRVTPNKWYGGMLPNNLLQEIGIKDGHPFLRAAIGALNLFRHSGNPSYSDVYLQDYILPALPIAYDTETGKTYLGKDYEEIHDNADPKIQKIATTYEIYESKTFPQLIKLSEVFQLIQDFAHISELKKKNGAPESPPSEMEKAVSSLLFHLESTPDEIRYPNFYAKFHQDPQNNFSLKIETKGLQSIDQIQANARLDLEELFIPGFLHLDQTHANFHLSYKNGVESQIDIENINALLKPMDFGKEDPRKLGSIQILSGEIADGEPIEYMGFIFPPGIHIHQLGTDSIQIQANLKIHTTLHLPIVGDTEIIAPLVFETQIKSNPMEFLSSGKEAASTPPQLIPQSTLLYIPSLQIQRADQSFYESNIVITDINSLQVPSQFGSGESGFLASIQLLQSSNTPLKQGVFEAFLPLSLDDYGSYILEGLLSSFEIRSHSSFDSTHGETIYGDINFSTYHNDNIREIILQGILDRKNRDGAPLRPLIDNFNFNLIDTHTNTSQQSREINIAADSVSLGPIELSKLQAQFNYAINRNSPESSTWTIHKLWLEANRNKGTFKPRGILSGPILIKNIASPRKPFQISFNSKTHQSSISNLGIRFDIKKIAPLGLSRSTDRAITGIDLDGLLQGNWNFDTETYAGKGRLLLRGDQEGDIHFRGSNGRRLEAVLDPNDPDRYYEIPLLADTRFTIDRINAFDTKHDQIKGHFHLSTLIDWLALKALGIQWNEHDRFEFDFDHFPYSVEGYGHKIREFFTYIATHPIKIPDPEGKK